MPWAIVSKRNHWLVIIPVLLLAATLAGRRLNTWTFSHDETSTLIAAGARNFGPRTFSETLLDLNARAPDQAFGWALFINLWGRAAGWSTVAVRAPAWFAGLFTLALAYRVGRILFHNQAGLFAILLLATSVYFISYLHVARAFTFVALFATLVIWSYRRVALIQETTGKRHWAGLLAGSLGLLYTHYFGALLLVALGLFHLLFAAKNRRWWQVALLFLLTAFSALPEIQSFTAGVVDNRHRYTYASTTLSSPAATTRLIYMLSNSLVDLPRWMGAVLVPALVISILFLAWRRPARFAPLRAEWYLAVLSLSFTGLILVANLFVPVLFVNRMRYFMALWPPVALLAGYGIWRLGRSRRRLADGLLVALVASGLALHLRSDLYLYVDNFEHSYRHLADQALVQQARPDDFLLLAEEALGMGPQASAYFHRYYTTVWTWPREFIGPETDTETLLQPLEEHPRVWLLARDSDSPVEITLAAAFHFCLRPVKRKGTVLTLYARTPVECT